MAPITAIEFTDLECKVVHADRGKGRAGIRALFSFALPKNDDPAARVAQRVQLLRDALKARKIKAGRVRVVIPKNYVMARMVTLPSNSPQEIAGMARFEAERHIPFNAERHVVSHHILSILGVQGSQVLLAAVDQPIAQEYLDICVGAGLSVESLGVSSLSMFNCFAAAEGDSMADKVIALVNVGTACTDLVIVNNGVLSFSRGSSLGVSRLLADLSAEGMDCTAADLASLDALEPPPGRGGERTAQPAQTVYEIGSTGSDSGVFQDSGSFAAADPSLASNSPLTRWLVQLLKELRRTYEFARREFNCPPIDHIHVCGEGALLKNLDRFFKVNFGVESAVFQPLKAFDVPAKTAAELASHGTYYVAASGAVAQDAPQSVKVNLVPLQYLQQLQAKRQKQSYITTGILALAALVLAFIYVSDLFTRQQQMLDNYRTHNKDMKPRVEDLEGKKTKLDIIQRYIQDKHGALDIIEVVSAFDFVPDRVTVTRFEYKKEEAVKLEGHAKTLPDVNRLESALKQTGFFDSVMQDQGSNKPVRLPNRTDQVLGYSITCTFPKRGTKNASTKAAPAAVKNGEESADGSQ
jgi:type IV pilus assembly protein PilM